MQTNFSLAQLADPNIAEANQILRACVHCGFCTATCPTYVLLGDELDSPRGRIYLIKDMLENDRPATAEVVKHVDRCLSCLACMTTCPSGVHYMHLVDHARAHIETTYRRPLADRMLRGLLAAVLPYRGRFRAALVAGALAKPLAPLFDALGLKPLAAMLRLSACRRGASLPRRRVYAPDRTAQRAASHCSPAAPMRCSSRRSTRRRSGCSTASVSKWWSRTGEACCGSLVHHMGREGQAHAQAKANIDAWFAEMDGEGLDAIVINASGCGTTVKDYGFMLRTDPAYAEKARAYFICHKRCV